MRARAVIVAAMASWLLAATVGRAAIRVEVDEVIFTLKAADAKEAYLVGDFNQWNPTVEPMVREGDEFVVRLFLVAGTYRYKFVVDGETIPDPDNPGPSPERGSPMVLVERSGGLILSTEIRDEARPTRTASYDARYIGFLFEEDGDTDVRQRVDLGVSATLDHLRARAVVATDDSSWTWSPPRVDAYFDRGFVQVEAGKFAVRGFENDSTWASSDPMGLVGNAGVYGYDAGFDYHGVTGVATGKHASLSARWADESTRGDVAAASVEDVSAFAAGNAADTTAYAYAYTFSGSDVLSVEGTVNTGAFEVGYIFRNQTGLDPGVWVDVARRPAGFATQTYATREDHHASDGWLAWRSKSAKLTFGYGWGGADARAYATASGASDLSTPLDATAATTPFDATRGILDTDRFVVGAQKVFTNVRVIARWDWARFDFAGVEGNSEADVHRAHVEATTRAEDWTLTGSVDYTDQKYRDTPDALYIDWPQRNIWLSRWDDMDVPSMVAIDLVQHAVWSLDAYRVGDRVDAGATALLQTLDLVDAPVHGSLRAHADATIRGPWYVYGDARWAWYDRDAWDVDESFFDLYVEGGYRKGAIAVSAGFGLDPWAFDPVVSDFADIGRSEYLRGAIDGGVRRSDATAIGRALVERERTLADLRVFKLECIIELR